MGGKTGVRLPTTYKTFRYSMSEANTVRLESSDGQVFEVARAVIEMSQTVKHMLEDLESESGTAIPLPNVTGKILEKVITYCRFHHEHPDATPSDDKKDEKRTDDIIPWDAEFCNVEQPTLFELILAANYLDIKPLLDLTCKTVANMIKGKTPEEIRKVCVPNTFNYFSVFL